jgi:hypothetical protein
VFSSTTPNRAAALNHLFFTIGNGYEWSEDGELVDKYDVYDKPKGKKRKELPLKKAVQLGVKAMKKQIGDMRKKFIDTFKDHLTKEQIAERLDVSDMDVPADIEERVKQMEGFNNWYPLSEKYSKVFTYPRNVKPEWKAAMIELCEFALKNPRTPERNMPQAACDKTTQEIKKALKKLKKGKP